MSATPVSARACLVLTAALAWSSSAFAAFPADFVVNSVGDQMDFTPGDGICETILGECTLRAAIEEANVLGRTAIIDIGLRPRTISVQGGQLDITGDIFLDGTGSTLDAAAASRIFDVADGASLTVRNLTLTGGMVTDDSGGAIRNAGTLRMRRSSITNSHATGAGASGGGIFNSDGLVDISDTVISGSSATRAGGAIEANAGITLIVDSEMSGNDAGAAPGNGGALHLTGQGVVTVIDSTIVRNVAASEGGGLWNSSTGVMTVDGCTLRSNDANGMSADHGGGGLFNDGGFMTVRATIVRDNEALMGSGSGGGVFNNGGELQIIRSLIEDNRSSRAGGGIEVVAGSTRIVGSRISLNNTGSSPGNGGGLHLTGAGDVWVVGTTVVSNTASSEGGGLWNSAVGRMLVDQSIIRTNTASGDAADQGGGGLFNDGGVMAVVDSSLINNRADGASGSGGGILNTLGTLTVTNTSLTGNVSSRAGGAIEANIGDTYLDDVVMTGNSTGPAPGNGGGVHLTGAGYVEVNGGAARRNMASNEGGGLWNSSTGVMVVTGMDVRANTAPINADLHNDGGMFTFDGVSVP